MSMCAWRFATKNALLIDNGQLSNSDVDPSAAIVPGYLYNYDAPSDLLQAQAVYGGARPGAPVWPAIDATDFPYSDGALLPELSGKASQPPFKIVGGLVFTDFG